MLHRIRWTKFVLAAVVLTAVLGGVAYWRADQSISWQPMMKELRHGANWPVPTSAAVTRPRLASWK